MASAFFPVESFSVESGNEIGVTRWSSVGSNHSPEHDLWTIEANYSTDIVCWAQVYMPNPVPSGTAALVIHYEANATSGDIRVIPEMLSRTIGSEGIGDAALVAIGNGTTDGDATWASGDAYEDKELAINLPSAEVTAGEVAYLKFTWDASESSISADVAIKRIGIQWR